MLHAWDEHGAQSSRRKHIVTSCAYVKKHAHRSLLRLMYAMTIMSVRKHHFRTHMNLIMHYHFVDYNNVIYCAVTHNHAIASNITSILH